MKLRNTSWVLCYSKIPIKLKENLIRLLYDYAMWYWMLGRSEVIYLQNKWTKMKM